MPVKRINCEESSGELKKCRRTRDGSRAIQEADLYA
jgi:hypothetical protein